MSVSELIPRQRRPLADTAAIAAMMGRTPGYVRLLVHKGVLQPVSTERTPKGATRLLFDVEQVIDTLQHADARAGCLTNQTTTVRNRACRTIAP